MKILLPIFMIGFNLLILIFINCFELLGITIIQFSFYLLLGIDLNLLP